MTNPPNIDAIIDELSEATGPDRRLDVLIGCAVGYAPDTPGCEWAKEPHWQYLPVPRITERIGCADKSGNIAAHWEAPHYTASLDAAMTLAEGFGGQITFFLDGTAKAFLWQPYPLAVESKGATPALALCIVSLRVRSALIDKEGGRG